jgi:hypothetical protein
MIDRLLRVAKRDGDHKCFVCKAAITDDWLLELSLDVNLVLKVIKVYEYVHVSCAENALMPVFARKIAEAKEKAGHA